METEIKVIDLYCGLGGWATGFIERGIDITGYDIVDFSADYPGKFVKADLLTYNDFVEADVIVSSPPCIDFSKASFPPTWKSVIRFPPNVENGKKLFNRVYEIVDIVKPKYYIIENVKGAQKFMGKARTHIGSRYFYGNFPSFNVCDATDIYGKTNISGKNRSSLRAKIPLSISRAFANKIIEVFK